MTTKPFSTTGSDFEQILRKLLTDAAFQKEFEQSRSSVIARYALPPELASALAALHVETYKSSYSASPAIGGSII